MLRYREYLQEKLAAKAGLLARTAIITATATFAMIGCSQPEGEDVVAAFLHAVDEAVPDAEFALGERYESSDTSYERSTATGRVIVTIDLQLRVDATFYEPESRITISCDIDTRTAEHLSTVCLDTAGVAGQSTMDGTEYAGRARPTLRVDFTGDWAAHGVLDSGHRRHHFHIQGIDFGNG